MRRAFEVGRESPSEAKGDEGLEMAVGRDGLEADEGKDAATATSVCSDVGLDAVGEELWTRRDLVFPAPYNTASRRFTSFSIFFRSFAALPPNESSAHSRLLLRGCARGKLSKRRIRSNYILAPSVRKWMTQRSP